MATINRNRFLFLQTVGLHCSAHSDPFKPVPAAEFALIAYKIILKVTKEITQCYALYLSTSKSTDLRLYS